LSESVKAAAVKWLLFLFSYPFFGMLRLFPREENGFYTFYTFYNVEKEVLIYSTYLLQSFYIFLQIEEKHKTFYKMFHFLQDFYTCRKYKIS